MATTSLNYRIGVDIGELRRAMAEAGTLTRQQSAELRAMEQQQAQASAAMEDIGAAVLSFGVAGAAGFALAATAAINWESAFAGVRKTVDGSPEEIAQLEGELRNLATTLPATHDEIAAVAEAAGQLGIKREDISAFTETMVALGETTNLTAEEAATGLAQLSNIMGTSAQDADRLGSTIVALGNSGASTEADILAMGQRIAGAGATAGLTEAEVLGLASALSSVGIEAEAGGTAYAKVITDIASATRNGGEELDAFAEVAGVSAEEFRAAYGERASSGIEMFVGGLGRIQTAGGDVFGVLDNLGYKEVRVRDALLRSANAGDLLATSIRTGSEAWVQNTALTEEAEKRYDTTAAKLQVVKNEVVDLAISIGSYLLPIVSGGADLITNLTTAFGNLPSGVQATVVALGAAAVSIALLGGGALVAIPKLVAMRAELTFLTYSAGALGVAARGASTAMTFMTGPWGAAIGLLTVGLGIWAAASGKASKEQEALRDHVADLSAELFTNNGAITSNTRTLAANALATADVGGETVDLLAVFDGLGISMQEATNGLAGNTSAADATRAALQNLIDTGTTYDDQGFESQGSRAKAAQEVLDAYNGLLGATEANIASSDRQAKAAAASASTQRTAAQSVAEALNLTAVEAAALGAAQGTAGEGAEGHTDALTDTEQALIDANEATKVLIEGLDLLNGKQLGMNDAGRQYQEALNGIAENLRSVDEGGRGFAATLDTTTEAGLANYAALDDLAEAGSAYAISVREQTGSFASYRNAIVSANADVAAQAVTLGMTTEAAQVYADSVIAIPDEAVTDVTTPGSVASTGQLGRVRDAVLAVPLGREVNVGALTEVAQQRLRDMNFSVRTLEDGTVAVTADTEVARTVLNNFVNQPRTAVVRILTTGGDYRVPGGTITQANGGVVSYYAAGGLRENHVAQIAPAGAMRVWAEAETGGEAYIPLAPGKRSRSEDILAVVAERFGYALAPRSRPLAQFAAGGLYGPPMSSAQSGGAGAAGPSIGAQFNGPVSVATPKALIDAVIDRQWDEIGGRR